MARTLRRQEDPSGAWQAGAAAAAEEEGMVGVGRFFMYHSSRATVLAPRTEAQRNEWLERADQNPARITSQAQLLPPTLFLKEATTLTCALLREAVVPAATPCRQE